MNLQFTPFWLEFKHPFGVSSNTRKETLSIFIKLEVDGYEGFGEACLPAYLGETEKNTVEFFGKARMFLRDISSGFNLKELIEQINLLDLGSNAAKAAIDIALHDLYGKIHTQTIAQIYGFKRKESMETSFTIGIDVEEKLIQKIEEAKDFSVLKIKAGTKNDQQLIETIRKYTNKPLYVDVNQGWTDKLYVLELLNWMKDQNVILVEQPMPVRMKEEMCWVTERSPITTIADESVKRLTDLENLKGEFSGVNIKLMKCTGIYEAIKMIEFCKENSIKILLGCMAESSCATSAMAQLMSFADYIDLDAPLLYKNDPFEGVTYKEGMVYVNDLSGIGFEPKLQIFE
ncbi:dipeptide epimerase [Aurantibacillus circumpalustris]|uniref:dipeptide epimerase n=1 Tax=Aurantibacillus circumpalustris TaxID=3036359 RepID=UPI00295AB797|nr:dipeptide epimerase [Aurantibacillus circumpalustris]